MRTGAHGFVHPARIGEFTVPSYPERIPAVIGVAGSSLPGRFVVELCEKIDLVQYLKEKKPPQGQSLSEVLAFAERARVASFPAAVVLVRVS